ncbi:MAG: Cof-type HAD-IIB family hydrolase [Gordonia sp. (in: high G+C Gram-positive bacteria)]
MSDSAESELNAALSGGVAELRMVVADMDGTLLTPDGDVPDDFWPLLDVMTERGVVFVPASGRQLFTLQAMFEPPAAGLSYVAENGSLVAHDGKRSATATVARSAVERVVAATRAAFDDGRDLGVVLCGVNSAYLERHDRPMVDEAAKYYYRLQQVDDLLAVDDDVLKLAVYDFTDSTTAADRYYSDVGDDCARVISGRHWIDFMSPGVDKGAGVRALQSELGISRAQTAVFGDYLNDLEMLDEAHWSFAMDNAHPRIVERARFRAPSNAEDGVVTVLRRLLG